MENKFEVALTKELCPLCIKELDGPLIMNKRLTKNDAKEVKNLHKQVIGFSDEPCKECKSHLELGFMIIGFDEDQSDLKNLPWGFYRTGKIVVVKKDSPLVKHLNNLQPRSKELGFIFMDDKTMKELNLIK